MLKSMTDLPTAKLNAGQLFAKKRTSLRPERTTFSEPPQFALAESRTNTVHDFRSQAHVGKAIGAIEIPIRNQIFLGHLPTGCLRKGQADSRNDLEAEIPEHAYLD